MNLSRLVAFSDGVLAIIITITVLSIRVPDGHDLAALWSIVPELLIYAFSFQTIGIYWNNHHHLLHTTCEVTTGIMWTNLHLLFWLSLIPFTTEWLGRNLDKAFPTAVYAFVLLMAGIAYNLLQRTIIVKEGKDSEFAATIGSDLKGFFSLTMYLVAIFCAFWNPLISYLLVILVAVMWFIPDRRLVRYIHKRNQR